MRWIVAFLFVFKISIVVAAKLPAPQEYRDLTLKVRSASQFVVALPNLQKTFVKYSFQWGQPIYPEPLISDLSLGSKKHVYRTFYDRIFLEENSYLDIDGQKVPLTCVFISGQDNRFSSDELSPLYPQLIFKVYIVANDYSCQGPLRPGWPETGGNKENWDTYLYYEIKDPTIMLPVEAKIRYRWNEFSMVLYEQSNAKQMNLEKL